MNFLEEAKNGRISLKSTAVEGIQAKRCSELSTFLLDPTTYRLAEIACYDKVFSKYTFWDLP